MSNDEQETLARFCVKHAALRDDHWCLMRVMAALGDSYEVKLATYWKNTGMHTPHLVGRFSIEVPKSAFPATLLAGLAAHDGHALMEVVNIWNAQAGEYALREAAIA